ncbi:triple tyrosine motif-containing protein [Pedobacter sp. PLR]|uniref:ligand-binding sensor domain-containing protein n=1 Tax=Pedobacter sp. PLR TaxID=2994465 RepID=UPI0022474D93|nr:sensor histidine kinase [Pedobacter sp. PLR]MCX2454045.1 triple tyrosine motif-containing protein [Pedobacter sp. PLR]
MYYKTISPLVLSLFLYSVSGFAQRYNFRQYDIENGLTQSQVTAITQDSKRRLWISTLGGLNAFNGKQFYSYTKTNGLNNNFVLALSLGKNDQLWLGTARGVSKFNGFQFDNYAQTKEWVSKLVTSATGTVYGLSSSRLFKTDEKQITFLTISNDPQENVTALKVDAKGEIAVAILKKGVFYLRKGSWVAHPQNEVLKDLVITDFFTDARQKDKLWLIASDGLYALDKNNIRQYVSGKFTAIEQDAKNNIWIGYSSGAYYLTSSSLIHFNGKNGFTNNMVNAIFKDVENNIWLATDGTGLFRYVDRDYVLFDESQGLNSKTVMSLADGPGNDEIWIGTYGGLFKYQAGKIKEIPIPSKLEDTRNINFLYNDRQKNIWIGTVYGGLWCYNGKSIVPMALDRHSIAYNAILEDTKGRIWVSTNAGCFLLNKKTKQLEPVSKQFGSALLETNEGEILVGTQDGVYAINSPNQTRPLNLPQLSGSSILCMAKSGPNSLLFGTSDNGILIWDRKTGKIKTLSTEQGLASDHIYSLLLDQQGVIWVGTGKGINKINAKDFKVIQNNNEPNLLVECNQNAILQHNDDIWVGTTKGAIVYNRNHWLPPTVPPYVYINSVTAFAQNQGRQNKQRTIFKANELGNMVTLPFHQNNLNISYTGIFLANPDGLSYQYRLIGLDNKYSESTGNTSTNFFSIPPGKYTFQVKAITKAGVSSVETASFSFEITPPYYQTGVFRLLIFVFIVLLILLAVYIILNLNERKRKLRLTIKLEEQFKVRKQTAEDFHDDLGNKLTRISVLSEVLSSMIDPDDTEKRGIISKINDNVNELYRGTKDILWSLNPKNDKLTELLGHIQEFGKEMFNNTSIDFQSHIDLAGYDGKLSLDVSRNLLMIFKEAIHNALKHAKPGMVVFSARVDGETLKISVKDDGQGLDPIGSMDGHGINNMNVRAKRINAKLNIISNASGTEIKLAVSLSTLMRLKNV